MPDVERDDKVGILMVDDRPENLLALKSVLEPLGENLVEAHSGREALRCLLRQDFGVIVLDVQMPEMDGFETAAAIRSREQSRDVPIIFITAEASDLGRIARGYSLLAVDYLLKPFDSEILCTKVRVLVDLHRKAARLKERAEMLRRSEADLEEVVKRRTAELEAHAARLEQSNRDLLDFAYVASHDLQEPVRKVLAFSDRLAHKYEDALDEAGRDYLTRMQRACQRMQSLVNDLLSFSRVSTGTQSFSDVDLNAVVRDVLSDLEHLVERTGARAEIGDLPVIEADSTQMRQLLQNLVGNALKFHQNGIPPIVKVSAEVEGTDCRLSVEDNGIGFEEEYLDRIFRPFQRLHNSEEYEGSGIGLAICRRIVERHGGSITARSAPGEGATFLVVLPIHQLQGDE